MKYLSLLLAIILPCTWYAKDLLILHDATHYQGKLMGVTKACVYIQDTSGSMISVPRDRIRSLMRDNKDITSSLSSSSVVIAKDVYGYFPSADSTSYYLDPPASALPPAPGTTLSSHILVPLWIIAGASVISLFASKKVKYVQ